jgi:hypothetical protein
MSENEYDSEKILSSVRRLVTEQNSPKTVQPSNGGVSDAAEDVSGAGLTPEKGSDAVPGGLSAPSSTDAFEFSSRVSAAVAAAQARVAQRRSSDGQGSSGQAAEPTFAPEPSRMSQPEQVRGTPPVGAPKPGAECALLLSPDKRIPVSPLAAGPQTGPGFGPDDGAKGGARNGGTQLQTLILRNVSNGESNGLTVVPASSPPDSAAGLLDGEGVGRSIPAYIAEIKRRSTMLGADASGDPVGPDMLKPEPRLVLTSPLTVATSVDVADDPEMQEMLREAAEEEIIEAVVPKVNACLEDGSDVFSPPRDPSFAQIGDNALSPDDLRALVRDIVQEELRGALGESITRTVRKLVRREIFRALESRNID